MIGTKDDQEEKWNDDHDIECNLSKEQKELLDYLCSSNRSSNESIFCSSEPINEFEPTDDLLYSIFPCLFPLGKCFKRSTGNLNNEQINLLLKQFHQIPSKDSRFLGYLADIKRLSEAIKKR